MAKIPSYTKALVLNRAVADESNLGEIQAAGAEARGFAQVADIGTQVAQKIKTTNDMTSVNEAVIRRQKEDIDFRQTKQQEWQDNPLGFAKEVQPQYEERDKAIMESLPSEEARQAYKANADKLNLKNYESDLNWETKRSTEMFANKADQSIADLETMAYRGTPLAELNKERAATTLTLGDVLSQDQLIKFDEKAEQRITSSYVEGLIDSNPYAAKKELDSKKYDDALGAKKLNSLNDKVESEIKAAEKALEVERNKRLTWFKDDPAQLAISSGVAPDDYEKSMEVQKKLGVAEGNISLLTKQQASLIVNQLNGVTSSDDMLTQMKQLQENKTPEEYNIVMRDLKKNGLSNQMAFIAMMNGSADKRVMDATFEMAKGEKNYKEIMGARGIKSTEVRDAIESKIADTRDILLAEGADVTDLNSKMESLATYFVAKGMDVNEAATTSTQWFTSKIPSIDINGAMARAPVDVMTKQPLYDIDTLERGLEIKLDSITADDIALTVGNGEFTVSNIKRTSKFILSPDEQSYYLQNEVGTPVLNKKGEILTFPITELMQEVSDEKASKQRKIFEENLLKLQSE